MQILHFDIFDLYILASVCGIQNISINELTYENGRGGQVDSCLLASDVTETESATLVRRARVRARALRGQATHHKP
jgi:hypothetical protein